MRSVFVPGGMLLSFTVSGCTEPRYGSLLGDAGDLEAPRTEEVGQGRDATSAPPDSQESGSDGGSVAAPDAQPPAQLEPDADVPTVNPADLTPDASQALPAWAEPLLGSYATQSVSFARDNTISSILSRLEELALVQIVRDGSGAQMHSKLCKQVADSREDELSMVNPSGLDEVRRTLRFTEDSWSTDNHPWGMGYERAVPADCVGKENQTMPKRPWQAWLASTCRCPGVPEAAPRSDDCRVLDPDNDLAPGLTYVDKGKPGSLIGAALSASFYAAYQGRTHPVRGKVGANGAHSAALVVDDVAYHLGCKTAGCVPITDASRPCTSDFNKMEFFPLPKRETAWTCDEVLAHRDEWFPKPLPELPASCTRQVLTDDPTR